MTPDQRAAFATWVAPKLDAEVRVEAVKLLSGGAIQENWRVDVRIGTSPLKLVVRKTGRTGLAGSRSADVEFRILQTAYRAGVLVPEPIALCDDPTILGRPFTVTAFVQGIAFGPRVVKDVSLGGHREMLLEQLGRELAKLHLIKPSTTTIPGLPAPDAHPSDAEIERLRHDLDAVCAVRPGLEWGLRWAELNAPKRQSWVLAHRDFRTGNYMVDRDGLRAILDWEFAGWSDPMSDIGWFCAECWRFSRPDLEAGGIGSREAFYRGYTSVTSRPVDEEAVRFWEIVAHLRWAVIALQQGTRHISGAEPSLALALTGRISSELELAVLRSTAPAQWN